VARQTVQERQAFPIEAAKGASRPRVVVFAVCREIPLARYGGQVYSSGDVKYVAIHEFGGVIPAHDVEAKKAQALHFVWEGKDALILIGDPLSNRLAVDDESEHHRRMIAIGSKPAESTMRR
jgi:hypothetical protein